MGACRIEQSHCLQNLTKNLIPRRKSWVKLWKENQRQGQIELILRESLCHTSDLLLWPIHITVMTNWFLRSHLQKKLPILKSKGAVPSLWKKATHNNLQKYNHAEIVLSFLWFVPFNDSYHSHDGTISLVRFICVLTKSSTTISKYKDNIKHSPTNKKNQTNSISFPHCFFLL